ncbi:hypothetical protein EMPS_06962 [Entomortierella parvispora]|uniref:Uncharacterized protein n=1 Tax=Entomortierella parvispora TaxID=205924 RepID=A0A9P3LXW9_9FUNG|nr:hypothetical protein EMPS_06962 [Entomortierella parvispora]
MSNNQSASDPAISHSRHNNQQSGNRIMQPNSSTMPPTSNSIQPYIDSTNIVPSNNHNNISSSNINSQQQLQRQQFDGSSMQHVFNSNSMPISNNPYLTNQYMGSSESGSSSSSSSSPFGRPTAANNRLMPIAPRKHGPSARPQSLPTDSDTEDALIQSEAAEQKKPSALYWKKPPVVAIVEWLSEPENYVTYTQRPGGQTMAQIQTEIANYVNERLGTKHTAKSINSILQYMRGKYQEAKRLMKKTGSGHTGRQSLREQILEHCPRFEELDKVFRGSLVHNAPAPHQSTTPYVPPEDDNNPSDLESGGDGSKRSKRRKEDFKTAEEIHRTFSSLQEHQNQTMASVDERRIREENLAERERALVERERALVERERAVSARELAVLERETGLGQRMKDMEDQHNRILQDIRNNEEKYYRERETKADARYKRRMEELQVEMEEFERIKERWCSRHPNSIMNRAPRSPSSPSMSSSKEPVPSNKPGLMEESLP